jgi:DNA-binding XRE family transcriptional regulator
MTGQQYREARQAIPASQASVAKLLGVTTRTLERREKGEVREAELAIHCLAAFFGFSSIFAANAKGKLKRMFCGPALG